MFQSITTIIKPDDVAICFNKLTGYIDNLTLISYLLNK
jgi:hypothetical protein